MLKFCQVTTPVELWDQYKEITSSNILLRVRNEFHNLEVNITPEILNKTLIVIENELLKIIVKR